MPDYPDYQETDRIDEADIENFLAAVGLSEPTPAPEPTTSPFSGFAQGPGPSAQSGIGDPTRDFTQYVAENTRAPEPARAEPTGVGFSGSFAPYAIPDLADNPAGRRMESGLSMLRDLFGVTEQGGTAGTAGGAYRDDWERQRDNQGKNFDDTVVDYGKTGIDTSGMERGGLPVQRVYALSGREMASEPIRNFGDLRNVPGSVVRRDDKGEPILDAEGRAQRYDLPGYNGQQRFGAGLREDRLENGQRVFYDPNNNLTYGVGKDGQPDRLLPGGLNYQGGASGGAYGLNPTTLNGRPVFYDEQGARTFERNGDIIGRNVASMPAPSAQRGGGYVPPRTPPPPPPAPPAPPVAVPPGDGEVPPPANVPAGIQREVWTKGNEGTFHIGGQPIGDLPPDTKVQTFGPQGGKPAVTRIDYPDGSVQVFDANGNLIQSGNWNARNAPPPEPTPQPGDRRINPETGRGIQVFDGVTWRDIGGR